MLTFLASRGTAPYGLSSLYRTLETVWLYAGITRQATTIATRVLLLSLAVTTMIFLILAGFLTLSIKPSMPMQVESILLFSSSR